MSWAKSMLKRALPVAPAAPARRRFSITAGMFALMGALSLTTSPLSAQPRPTETDLARFLAGMPVSETSPLAPLTETRGWLGHAGRFDRAYADIETRQLAKIRAWSETHLTNPQGTLLYMFSGPDYLYADAFFPDADTYVLAGLEPVGAAPDIMAMPQAQWNRGLIHLNASLNTVFSFSFFRTRDMRTQLRQGGFEGVTPILYVFLARAGKTIDDVTFVELTGDGGVRERTSGGGTAPGVRIRFSTPGQSAGQTLYYFQTNIRNDGLANSGFLDFMAAFGPTDAFVKSASYLMHYEGFSRIRDFLLTQSVVLVQDDSGVPLRHIDQNEWELTPFGRYVGPIELFAEFEQGAMRRLFANAQSIDFGIGYRWRPFQSHVLLAQRRR